MNDNLSVLILAAGYSERFNGLTKQLLPLNKQENIIERIVRQCKANRIRPTVITCNEIIQHAVSTIASYYPPKMYDTVCHSIASSRPLWCERTLFLLGDVIYSNRFIRRLIEEARNMDGIRFYGNEHEIFAFSFRSPVRRNLMDAINIVTSLDKPIKIRHIFRCISNYGLKTSQDVDELKKNRFFSYVVNYALDIDTPSQYIDLINSNRMERMDD